MRVDSQFAQRRPAHIGIFLHLLDLHIVLVLLEVFCRGGVQLGRKKSRGFTGHRQLVQSQIIADLEVSHHLQVLLGILQSSFFVADEADFSSVARAHDFVDAWRHDRVESEFRRESVEDRYDFGIGDGCQARGDDAAKADSQP